MSELEIRRRQEYKKNRKKWSVIQIVAIIIVAAIAIGSLLIYDRMNRTYYIEYTENSCIDYKVQYKENEYFEDEWIGENQEYIASLINGMAADFQYRLNMDTSSVGFNYQYKIDATVIIADKNSGNPYRTYTENLLPLTNTATRRSNDVEINEKVSIDFNRYNDMATDFIKTYSLKNATTTLVVTLDVEVLSTSENFKESNENKYSTSLNIPLTEETLTIFETSSAPKDESKVLAYNGAHNKDIFKVLAIVFGCITGLLVILLLAFLQLTRNEDITYAARVARLVNAYGSYIQRIEGDFDDAGYQNVVIKTFNELLGIRDTIQSPILMSENRDETMTRFLIPTNTKILYIYEIKVDNFDLIYGLKNEAEETVILNSNVSAEEIEEAMAQPDVILSEIEYEEDDDAEFEVAADEPGVEVVGVVWPERAHKNKVYRYDPNGEELHKGDIVLVPTRDAARDRSVIRKAAVAHENHRVDPEHIKHPLKKIIGVIKRRAEEALAGVGSSEK